MTDTGTDRFEALEMRLAHQEHALDELNAIVTEQWRVIDELKWRIGRLDAWLAEAEASLPASSEKPPPHY